MIIHSILPKLSFKERIYILIILKKLTKKNKNKILVKQIKIKKMKKFLKIKLMSHLKLMILSVINLINKIFLCVMNIYLKNQKVILKKKLIIFPTKKFLCHKLISLKQKQITKNERNLKNSLP